MLLGVIVSKQSRDRSVSVALFSCSLVSQCFPILSIWGRGCLWCLGGVWVLSEGPCVLLEGDSIKQIGKGQLVLQCSAAVLSPNSFQ